MHQRGDPPPPTSGRAQPGPSATRTSHRLLRLWWQLTEPSPHIQDPERRRRARLLSGILVAVLPVSFVAAGLSPFLVNPSTSAALSDPMFLAGVSACLGGAGVYLLSRSRHTELAAGAAVLMAVYGTWASVFASMHTPHQGSALYFVSLSVLVASALLPMAYTASLAVATMAGLLVLPVFYPAVTAPQMVNPVLFTLFSSALMVAFAATRHQDLAQIRASLAEAEASNRELERFAYIASHDLQEPLRQVASYTQLLERRYGDALDEDGKTFVQYTVDGAHRMQQLIRDLLAFSRAGRDGTPSVWVDANASLKDALANLETALQENEATVNTCRLPEVRCNPGGLIQIFQNLVGNAVKFQDGQRPVVTIQHHPDGRFHRFSVSDNGIGMDPRYAEKIFQPFQRLHGNGRYPGTGIGLALCKRIVENEGGEIWVESAPGQGATFHFTLPMNT